MNKPWLGRTVEERFWSKVNKSGPIPLHIPELGECWVWAASRDGCGYGSFGINGKNTKASRVSWTLANGAIPKGMHVLHKCDNRSCVRPEHLFVGSHIDNMTDMRMKRRGRGKDQAGEKHSMAKLSAAQVLEIRKLRDEGFRQNRLAVEFGVHKATINDIVLRKTWAHLP